MITIVDDNRELVHIVGLSYSHVKSLCGCIKRLRHSQQLLMLEMAREIPAHFFYRYGCILLLCLSWRQVCVLEAGLYDMIADRPDIYLIEILEALEAAFQMGIHHE